MYPLWPKDIHLSDTYYGRFSCLSKSDESYFTLSCRVLICMCSYSRTLSSNCNPSSPTSKKTSPRYPGTNSQRMPYSLYVVRQISIINLKLCETISHVRESISQSILNLKVLAADLCQQVYVWTQSAGCIPARGTKSPFLTFVVEKAPTIHSRYLSFIPPILVPAST